MLSLVVQIRNRLAIIGKSNADLARNTGIAYRRLSGYLSCYWELREEELRMIESKLKEWENGSISVKPS